MSQTDPHLIDASQLEGALGETSMDARRLVRRLLSATPYDEQGRKKLWPALDSLRVADLLAARVQVPGTGHEAVVSGFYAASLVLAAAAAGPLVRSGALTPEGYAQTEEQLEAFYEVCRRMTQPVEQVPVREMLLYAPVREGFFRGYHTYDLDELEKLIRQSLQGAADAKGVVRLVDEVQPDGHRLTVWRTGYASECGEGEKLYDISAIQTDLHGAPRMYADLRVTCLPKTLDEAGAFWILDAYDDEGLELGYGLKQLVRQGMIDRQALFNGTSIVHLQTFEVRQNLRGQGLGAKFLKGLLPPALKGVRAKPGHLVATAAPMQFDFPLEATLPAEFLLDALDQAERLQEYLRTADVGAGVPGLKGKPLLVLPHDERVFGTQWEQMKFLSENSE